MAGDRGLSSLAFTLAAHALLRRFETLNGGRASAAPCTATIADGHTHAAAMRWLGKGFEDRLGAPAVASSPASPPAWPSPPSHPREWRRTGPLAWYGDTH